MIAKCKVKLTNEIMSEIMEGEAIPYGLVFEELYFNIDLNIITVEEMTDKMFGTFGSNFEIMSYEQ